MNKHLLGWAAATLDTSSVANGGGAKYSQHKDLVCEAPTEVQPPLPAKPDWVGTPMLVIPGLTGNDQQSWYFIEHTNPLYQYRVSVIVGDIIKPIWLDDSFLCVYGDDGHSSPAPRQLSDGPGKAQIGSGGLLCNDDCTNSKQCLLPDGDGVGEPGGRRVISQLSLRGDGKPW